METDAIALNFEDALKKVSKNTKLAFEGIYGTQLTYQNDFKLDGVLLSDLLSGEEEPLHARFDEELLLIICVHCHKIVNGLARSMKMF